MLVRIGRLAAKGSDFDNGRIWLSKNGVWFGDPSTDTGYAYTFTPATVGALAPCLSQQLPSAGAFKICADAGNQTYAPPTGFSRWAA